jgi:predicted ribosome quality control (RQC) complex YloA/Tae2 family protein
VERRADGAEGAKTAVDWCPVRNVKKPPGAKPGMVTYENHRTMLVTPRPPRTESEPSDRPD